MSTAAKPDLKTFTSRMDKAVQALKDEFAGLRTGRASAGLIEPVMVEAYGSSMPITQCGAISVPEPRMITVNVWDRGLVVSVEKAIRNSGLGLNPIVEGQLLRIPIPALTEDRRKDLVKLAGKYAEQQRIAVRNVRRDANDDLKKAEKDHAISEDEHKKLGVEVQHATDAAIKRIDEALKVKEQEIMQV
ncbi:MAG: ribosome recycling factor [Proteobacteria bacterium]|nr:ribosome recycling factor [Pseudomonadota bacterium]